GPGFGRTWRLRRGAAGHERDEDDRRDAALQITAADWHRPAGPEGDDAEDSGEAYADRGWSAARPAARAVRAAGRRPEGRCRGCRSAESRPESVRRPRVARPGRPRAAAPPAWGAACSDRAAARPCCRRHG